MRPLAPSPERGLDPRRCRPLPALLALVLLLPACRTKRVLRVESDPPGAVVRLDEERIGTTPLEHEFVHGGRRRLSLYRPGFRTWSRRVDLRPPWYARFPLDVLTEVLVPLGLEHEYEYDVRLPVDTGELNETPVLEAYLTRAVARWEEERGGGGEQEPEEREPEE